MNNIVFYVFEGENSGEKIDEYLKIGKINDEIHYLTNNQLGVEYYHIVEKNGKKEAVMYANYDSLTKDDDDDDDLFKYLLENELKDEPPKKKSKNKK
jgi:hypothetical protein